MSLYVVQDKATRELVIKGPRGLAIRASEDGKKVTSDIVGDVTGDVTGNADTADLAAAIEGLGAVQEDISGAGPINAKYGLVTLSATGAAAVTLAAPGAGAVGNVLVLVCKGASASISLATANIEPTNNTDPITMADGASLILVAADDTKWYAASFIGGSGTYPGYSPA